MKATVEADRNTSDSPAEVVRPRLTLTTGGCVSFLPFRLLSSKIFYSLPLLLPLLLLLCGPSMVTSFHTLFALKTGQLLQLAASSSPVVLNTAPFDPGVYYWPYVDLHRPPSPTVSSTASPLPL